MATLLDKLLAKAAAKDLVTATRVITADTPFLSQFEDFDDFIFRAGTFRANLFSRLSNDRR